jgi:hypothetical protein
MTGPRIDPFADLIQDPFADLGASANTVEPQSSLKTFLSQPVVEERKAKGGYASLADLGKGVVEGGKRGLQNLLTAAKASQGLGGIAEVAQDLMSREELSEQVSGFQKVGRMGGQMVAELPLYGAASAGLGIAGKAAANAVKSPVAKALLSGITSPGATKTESVIKAIVAGVPQEVATGMLVTAATNPAALGTKEGFVQNVGSNALGSMLRGFSGAKNFDMTLQGNKTFTIPELAGSGVQSTHPYIPVDIPSDPYAMGLVSKFPRIPDAGLSEAEKGVAKHMDFDNRDAQIARLNKHYLLNTSAKKTKNAVLDFLQPIKEVSEDAYDMASKFLRIGRRQQIAVTDRLFIPQGNDYVEGAASLPTLLKAAGGDAASAQRLQMYAHSQQVLGRQSATTPIEYAEARDLVDAYKFDHPQVTKAYEEVYQPLTQGMVDMLEGYNLVSKDFADQMRLNPSYAPLSRSSFGNAGMGMTKARGEVKSTKKIADLYSTLSDNIRSIVYNGERSKIIREMVIDATNDPSADLRHHVKIKKYGDPDEEIKRIVKSLPNDIPETIRVSLAEAMYVPPKGAKSFVIRMETGPVRVELSDELAKSLDLMQSRATPITNPVLKGAQRVEKGIGVSYSYFRDVFGAGPLFDALEARSNLGEQMNVLRNPFSLLSDIGKGLKANLTDDPRLLQLEAYGAGKGFRGANPAAEMQAHSTKDLIELGTKKGMDLHLAHPVRFAEKLAGDLANAVSAASSLRALENGASYPEAASIYNTVLGDPYKAGAKTAAYARYVNFFNYPLQANARMLENFTKSPASAAMAAGKAAGLLSVPTAALWFLQQDDEQLRDLRQDPSGKNYVFMRNPFDESQVYSFRKPFLYGAMFMTPIETILDELQNSGDTETLSKIGRAVLGETVPNVLPLTANAVLPLYTGQRVDPFQGATAIIPRSRAGLLPEDQGDMQASESSRLVAEATGISAGKVENIFKTFMVGPIYQAFNLADDYVFEGQTAKPATFNGYTLIPGVKKTDVSKAGIKYVNQFYDEVGKAQQVLGSLENASKNNRPDRWMNIMAKHGDKIPQYEMIASYKRDMDAISGMINSIKLNEMYSPEQKREQIDMQVALRILTARQAMELYKGIKD